MSNFNSNVITLFFVFCFSVIRPSSALYSLVIYVCKVAVVHLLQP